MSSMKAIGRDEASLPQLPLHTDEHLPVDLKQLSSRFGLGVDFIAQVSLHAKFFFICPIPNPARY